MKVVIKTKESGIGVAQDLLFQDKDIHKLKC
jgi:hypothetical protein